RSAATTASVQTLSPPPPNPLSVNVPALAAGKAFVFSYSLAAACDNHQVQVVVPQDNDANPADNTLQVSACLPQNLNPLGASHLGVAVPTPIPAPNHPVVDTLLCQQVDPDTCPGTHTIDLQPSATARSVQIRNENSWCLGDIDPPHGGVGWFQDGG